MSGSKKILCSILGVLSVCLLWELGGYAEWIDLRFFPVPSMIVGRFFRLLADKNSSFLQHLEISLLRVFWGALIACPLAVLVAVYSELSPFFGSLLRPWIAFLYPLPKLALLPLLLVIFGLGEASKVALVALGIFFLVFLNTSQGIRRIMSSEYYDVALVYRIPVLRRIFHVLLRGAIPEMVNGTKMGIGYGLVMVIAAEFAASEKGIGVFIWNAWDRFQILDLYAGLLAVSLLGWLIFQMAGFVERKFTRY